MSNIGPTIREVGYLEQAPEIRAIRFAVFVDEQNVPPDIEMDDRDPLCIHLLAYIDERPVGTARIDFEYAGKIGRLAVLANCRGRGIGRALMKRCHEIARQRRLTHVWCNAQTTAVTFYERIGYTVIGDEFDEAGISHRKMTAWL
jgi:predicted GNAT family N-acyltransferase